MIFFAITAIASRSRKVSISFATLLSSLHAGRAVQIPVSDLRDSWRRNIRESQNAVIHPAVAVEIDRTLDAELTPNFAADEINRVNIDVALMRANLRKLCRGNRSRSSNCPRRAADSTEIDSDADVGADRRRCMDMRGRLVARKPGKNNRERECHGRFIDKNPGISLRGCRNGRDFLRAG